MIRKTITEQFEIETNGDYCGDCDRLYIWESIGYYICGVYNKEVELESYLDDKYFRCNECLTKEEDMVDNC